MSTLTMNSKQGNCKTAAESKTVLSRFLALFYMAILSIVFALGLSLPSAGMAFASEADGGADNSANEQSVDAAQTGSAYSNASELLNGGIRVPGFFPSPKASDSTNNGIMTIANGSEQSSDLGSYEHTYSFQKQNEAGDGWTDFEKGEKPVVGNNYNLNSRIS